MNPEALKALVYGFGKAELIPAAMANTASRQNV
jgi:hypothetical protein